MMATLRKKQLKSGYVYVIDFRYQGERHVRSTGTHDARLARQILMEIEERMVRGTFRMKEYEGKDIKASEFVADYFVKVAGTKKSSTIAGEKIYTKKFIRIVGDAYLRTIDLRVTEYWRSELLKSVGPVTYNIELRFMKMLFGRAVELGYLNANPFKKLKLLRVDEKRLYLNSEEIKSLLNQLDANIQHATNDRRRAFHYKFKLFCEILLNTGMRRDEALSLTPEQIDLNRNIIVVERSKGKRVREIPMTQRVRAILSELGPHLFRGMTGGTASRKFKAAADMVGLKNMKLHSLRHTFATMMVALGYDIKVVKELLGHEDIRITEIYAKAGNHILQKAIRSFEELHDRGYDLVTRKEGRFLEE
jgi:integrase